jgi:anaerobic ribonucleoside-triphosphate reductase
MRSFDSSQRNIEDEGTSQHVLKAENTIRDCDWSTSELGIKMAIQYQKNKDEVTKSEKQGLNLDNLDEQTNLPFIRPEMPNSNTCGYFCRKDLKTFGCINLWFTKLTKSFSNFAIVTSPNFLNLVMVIAIHFMFANFIF